MQQDSDPNPYRMLQLVVRHGAIGVNLLSALFLLAGLGAAFVLAAWWLAPLALVGVALFYIGARSFVELVHVIVDMLVPK